jgi:hypothetical protein
VVNVLGRHAVCPTSKAINPEMGKECRVREQLRKLIQRSRRPEEAAPIRTTMNTCPPAGALAAEAIRLAHLASALHMTQAAGLIAQQAARTRAALDAASLPPNRSGPALQEAAT